MIAREGLKTASGCGDVLMLFLDSVEAVIEARMWAMPVVVARPSQGFEVDMLQEAVVVRDPM